MNDFLQEGDVIELGIGHKVYANVPEHFIYQDKRGSWKLTKTDIDLSNQDFDYLRGIYVVTKTEMTGGGTGHGRHDVYPNGHKVTAKMGGDGEEVSFYQSGCFTAMISKDDIKPIGKAKQFWTIGE